jgi:inhibitor of cysteine peptidase
MWRVALSSIPALAALAVITACQRGVEISPAPIHEVDVRFAESYPVQVFVYIKGGLRDGCTIFHDLVVERDGDTVIISVTTERPKKAVCPAVYGYFEKNVALGTNFSPGETYTLKVNDFTTTFTYPP